MQHRSRQHTHIHTHTDLCLWGGIGHAQQNHIIHRVCYTSAPTASWPQALQGSGISFALQWGLPRGQALQSPGTTMAPGHGDGQGGRAAAPRPKGSLRPAASFLQLDHNVVEDISSAQLPCVAQEELQAEVPHPQAPSLLQPKTRLQSFSSQNHLCGEDTHKSSKKTAISQLLPYAGPGVYRLANLSCNPWGNNHRAVSKDRVASCIPVPRRHHCPSK